jgi:hypothetical protein
MTLGLSRRRLFSLAVSNLLWRRRKDGMLKKLNEVYAGEPDPAEPHLVIAMKAKAAPSLADRWLAKSVLFETG